MADEEVVRPTTVRPAEQLRKEAAEAERVAADAPPVVIAESTEQPVNLDAPVGEAEVLTEVPLNAEPQKPLVAEGVPEDATVVEGDPANSPYNLPAESEEDARNE